MNDDRVKTKIVGHREPRYPGEPKSKREIYELVDPVPLKYLDKK